MQQLPMYHKKKEIVIATTSFRHLNPLRRLQIGNYSNIFKFRKLMRYVDMMA